VPAKTKAACERGGSAYSRAFPRRTLCTKDTRFNYFLLKRILEHYFLVRCIFAIVNRSRTNRSTEGAKQGAAYPIIPFRVPLHPKHKAFGGRHRYRFDQSIWGARFDKQARR